MSINRISGKSMQPNNIDRHGGEVIFSEGRVGRLAYIIKTGSIEISVIRDGKKIVLAELGAGACFGEMAPILGGIRSATATATSYTELYVVDKNSLDKLLKQANPLLRATIHSLIKRLKKLNECAVKEANPTSPIEVYANILTLLAHAYANHSKQDHHGGIHQQQDSSVEVPMPTAIRQINIITGDAKFHIEEELRGLVKVGLIRIEGTRKNPVLKIDPGNIRDQAKGISKTMGDSSQGFQTEQDLIELDELSTQMGIEEEKILQTLVSKNIADDYIVFHKGKFIELLKKEGPEFFEPEPEHVTTTAMKQIEFDKISDIEFLDRNSLFKIVSKFDQYDLACLLFRQPESIKRRMVETMSKRNRIDVIQTIKSIEEVEENDFSEIERRFIYNMKELTSPGGNHNQSNDDENMLITGEDEGSDLYE